MIIQGRYYPSAKVVFVDLDETLITSMSKKPETPLPTIYSGGYWSVKRPGAIRLLAWMKNIQGCEVYILSAGSTSHVARSVKGFGLDKIVDGYISMDDVYGDVLQDIHRGRPWLLIEDRPLGDGIVMEKMKALGNLHASHYRHVKPFQGDPRDRELFKFATNPRSLIM